MPHNDAQWLIFLLFGLGAIGGLAYLVSLGVEVTRAALLARRRGRLD
jgi:hypothetical protein